MSRNKHIGSDFDAFLAEQGELEEATAVAVKRVIAWQIEQAMQATGVNKSALAKRMHTSRTVVDRMLDATDTGLTLETMTRAATALGFKVKIDLVVV
jgi:antitoxin HicB